MMPEYLFVRILEACNAGCVMCKFANSRDKFRTDLGEFCALLDRAASQGTRVVRLTGGEPLMHREVVTFVASIADRGMAPSLITNGWLLDHLLADLVDVGLAQVIVSIDGATPKMHDTLRRMPHLFERAINGLRHSVAALPAVRVNTVAGPDNFRELPALQDLLTEIGVGQWELSSLKLERRLDYRRGDESDLDAVVRYIYDEAGPAGRLVPMGKPWCGRTVEERTRYLGTGVPPRPDRRCHVVDHVRYVDARALTTFPCSLLPHRPIATTISTVKPSLATLDPMDDSVNAVAAHFAVAGPNVCTGCSATAAGYSNDIDAGGDVGPWAF
jgi:cytosylglucuronate decarboxylase